MAIRAFDSYRLYFMGAVLLALAALVTQFEVRGSSRAVEEPSALSALAARNREQRDLNLVFLLVDTLRADRLGVYGYPRPTSPNIDALASGGVLFEDVGAQSTWTKTSMASLWTATHPVKHGVLRFDHALPDAVRMPAEILREAGYRTVGIWRNGWVDSNFGFAQGFDTYLRPLPGAERIRVHQESRNPNALAGSDEELTLAALDFLEQFGARRFFLYLHYMDVHQYAYGENSTFFGTAYSDVYDRAIHWTDRLVGALVAGLAEHDLLDRTLIVLAADHGEAFREHGLEGHGRDLYRETTQVPLILSLPFRLEPGVRVSQTVSNVDIWPTLLDLLGLPALPGADGRSLLPLVLADADAGAGEMLSEPRPAFSHLLRGWGNAARDPVPLLSVTLGPRRLIAIQEDPPRFELYDREADPREQFDLYPETAGEAAGLRALLEAYQQEVHAPWGEAPLAVEIDELRLSQLRALGYSLGR